MLVSSLSHFVIVQMSLLTPVVITKHVITIRSWICGSASNKPLYFILKCT